jgi:predicted TIM-barrel fold metal-dependent hydrolase
MTARRIDTHHHFVPPFYREWLESKGVGAGGLLIPEWSPQASLELMEAHEIETAVLSVSTPGVEPGRPSEARAMARRLNEYAAEIVRQHDGRFRFFAILTLPDVDGALAELAYALDELSAEGVVLHGNCKGIYLGDPRFDPLFDELQRREAVVFVHPSVPPGPGVPGIPAYAADFLLDSVRAALNLARTGTLDRCPDLKIILSHGGGFLPFAGARLSALADSGGSVEHGYRLLQRFYLDSALASSPFALPSTLAWAQSDHLTFGSDFPYARPEHVAAFTAALDQDQRVDHEALNRANAAALLPRRHEHSLAREGMGS